MKERVWKKPAMFRFAQLALVAMMSVGFGLAGLVSNAEAAVALLSTPTSGVSTAASVTFSHNNPGGTDTMLIVGVGWDGRDSETLSSVTYSGQALTCSTMYGTSDNRGASAICYRLNPATGTNNVVVTTSGNSSGKPRIGTAVVVSGAKQAAPAITGTGGTNTTATLSGISSAGTDMVIGVINGYKATTSMAPSGSTEVIEDGSSGTNMSNMAYSMGASSLTWNNATASSQWGIAALVVPQASVVCTANAPTVTFSTANQTITTNGGNAVYNYTVKNNDTAACTNTTFSLGVADSNSANFTTTRTPTTVALAPGATSAALAMTVTAQTGSNLVSNTSTLTASATGHTSANGTRSTNINVPCTPAAAPTIGGNLSGNPANLCSVVTAGSNTPTNYSVTGGGPAADDNFNDNSLAPKWSKTDFGPDAGTVSETVGQLNLAGGGADIWNTADEFTYLSQSGISGDFSIQVRVLSQDNTNAWAKAGLMVRQQLTAGSKDAYMVTTPGNGSRWQYRDVTDAAALNPSTNLGGSSTAPVWLRITRVGNTFTGEFSTNGSTWTTSGSNTVVMADPVYIGLANTSHSLGVLSTAVFDDFVTTGLSSTLYSGASCNSVPTTSWTNGTYDLNVTYTNSCGTSGQSAAGTFVWSSCTETKTLTLQPITNPITGATSVTATGTATNILVGTSPSPTNTSGWVYNPAQDNNTTTVSFYATGTGTCGTITRSQLNVATNTMAKPVVTNFTIPASVIDTTAPFVVPVTTFTATDNLAVTGYMITRTATAPTAGAAGWTGTAPTSYTVPAQASYTLYAWAKDAAGNVSLSASAPVTVSSCTEAGTVSLNLLPNPILSALAVSATAGGGATSPQVSFDGGTNWVANGSIYTPASQVNYPVSFAARATGTCGGFIYDSSNPTTVQVDSRTNNVESNIATALQSGLSGIAVTMGYCGDKNGNATFQVDYKLASSGTWIIGTAQIDTTNDGVYLFTIAGLTSNLIYDVRMTYADPDVAVVGTGALVQTAVVNLVGWVDSPMLHNALRFACSLPGYFDQASCETAAGVWDLNRKYVGGWGTPGNQYGAIMCSSCHAKETGNVKRVTTSVAAATGSFPGSVVNLQTVEDGTSDFGNDTGGHATSNKICETCHSATSYHRYDTAGQAVTNHYNDADCVKCHAHNAGFRASCTNCHGNPPLANGELTATLNPANSTGSTNFGAHQRHAAELGFVCTTCHTGTDTTGQMPNFGNINIGFNAFGKSTGTYDGRTVGNGGKYTANPGMSLTQTKASGTTTCAFYCHGYGTPQWSSTGTVACGACHGQAGSYGDDRAGAPTGVATSRDLSGALTGFKVGKHANHLDDSIAATGDPCALCHNGFGYANSATHVNGTVNVSLNAAAGGTATFTPGAPGTCSNLSCHGTAQWNSTVTGGCNFCHGYPPTSATSHAAGVTAVNHDKFSANGANVTANHDQCSYCHGVKDGGSSTMVAMPTSVLGGNYTYVPGTDHQDGKVTMNGNATAGADAGYNSTNAGCDTAACHANDASHRLTTGGAATVQLRDFGPGSCGACHNTGVGGAPVVTSTSTHVKVTKTGTYGDCTNCHAGHTTATGGVDIPNNATIGINYSTTGHAGIQLGGTGTNATISALTTEAQICWACHDQAANAISEWGANTKTATGSSPFNYGNLTTSNWTTATWSSSRTQFAYKTGAIQSTHTANPAVTDANLGGAAYSRTESPNAVAEIRCSYCHDVHELARASGDTKAGTPYLRGNWMGNPYEEDGAPRGGTGGYANTTYFSTSADMFGQVPRGAITGNQKIGGYWIDQNNVRPMSATTTTQGTSAANPTATWTVDQFGGLCALCHGGGNASWSLTEVDNIDQKTGEALWMGTNGHANSVKGGTGAGSANSFNVFNTRGGTTTISQNNPRQHYFGQSDPADSSNGVGFRSANSSALRYTPALRGGNTRPQAYNTDRWVVDETGATKENQYHKFSCSKCHNPHASRLPKLMITNCLDTVHNTWDNQFQLNTSGSSLNNNREIAQWTSAQNCHRYSESNNTTTTSPEYRASRAASPAGSGAGWNKVTPWKQTTNTP